MAADVAQWKRSNIKCYASAFSNILIFHARTKHIEVDYHFVREKVLNRDMLIKYISIADQLTYLFTKSLPSPRFRDPLFKLMGLPNLSLGGCKDKGSAARPEC